MTDIIPSFFVYGEPDRPLDVGFMHVETVMARKNLHFGVVEAHKHDNMGQITFWTKGRGRYFIEDQSLDFLAPAVSFVPSGVVHGFTVAPDETDAIVVSVADGALVAIQAQTSLALNAPVMVTERGEGVLWSRLAAMMDAIAEEYADGRPGMQQVLPSMTAVALTQIARLASGIASPAQAPQVVLAAELRRLVDRGFRENWPIERYTEMLGTTPHLLGKACRTAFGMPVKELIGERRLLEAKRLLLFTVRSVEDIAYEVGFRDAAYFSRSFRARTGMPPSDWRRAHPEFGMSGDGIGDPPSR